MIRIMRILRRHQSLKLVDISTHIIREQQHIKPHAAANWRMEGSDAEIRDFKLHLIGLINYEFITILIQQRYLNLLKN